MLNKQKQISVSGTMILLLVFINALILKLAFIHNRQFYLALIITIPLLVLAIYDVKHKKVQVLNEQKS